MDPVLTKLIVIFMCSMIAAVVLFKFVGATADVDGQGEGGFGLRVLGFRAGGSIAGFLLVYALMQWSFERLQEKSPTPSVPIRWTITGTVTDGDAKRVAGVDVSVEPPEQDTTNYSGKFSITNVSALTAGEFPDIEFPRLVLDHKPFGGAHFLFEDVDVKDFEPKRIGRHIIKLEKPIVPVLMISEDGNAVGG
jgi:hypothetical protein